ncbi:MAG: phosphoenolpyruvate--protein phosphotransferase [Spirochaetales bacterium]|nr:phosphoenolpyruvate--protein phosphotransferase [Spirochaetales bacterium]
MKTLKGIVASPGIIIGKAYLYLEKEYSTPKYDIKDSEILAEHERFLKAVESATIEIKELKKKKKKKISKEECRLLDSHILMLNDPDITREIITKLHEKKKNVEWILLQVIEENIDKLNATQNEYLKERTTDFVDISQRILRHLLFKKRRSLADLEKEVVLVAGTLLPSDVIGMNKEKVKGIATDGGTKTSHIAILARSFEIPAVVGLSDISTKIESDDELIIDGNKGEVIITPDDVTKKNYRKTQKKWLKHELQLLNMNKLPATTRDGKIINLKANIETPDEVKSAIAHGADGIGLYRSEFLFIQPTGFPSEDEQYKAYSTVLEAMKDKSVCIRTLDYGGEKIIPDFDNRIEGNPLLGWRAVRFYRSYPDIFKTQVRAILRASVHGRLKMMFPMISGIDELKLLMSMVESVKKDLRKKKIEFVEDIDIGIMIEVPSAALTSDILARHTGFFSIGTNDLIQYTLAVDRGNERVAYLYEPFHPGVIRLIQQVIDNAKRRGIPVEMCGEMAGNPYAVALLVGLGLDSFSLSPVRIPEVKKIIRSINMSEAACLVDQVLSMEQTAKIEKTIVKWMEEKLDFNSGKS